MIDTKHPQYTHARLSEWQLMREAESGESAIKGRAELYLPKPSGFKMMPDRGVAAYRDYRMRSTFPEILAPSLSALIGIAHGKEIQIDIPAALEYLWENVDGEGTPLEVFHRKITRELLLMGRYGVLADAPEGGGEPYLAGYCTESLINWDTDFFVLNESGPVRDGFDWVNKSKYRVLEMNGGWYAQTIYEGEATVSTGSASPQATGGRPLNFVPFAVASGIDLSPDVRTSPLIGVARAALAIYQLDADQRYQLYMSGQETLVIVNGEVPDAVGAGVVIQIETGEGVTGDAKYVSPTCSGIAAHGEKIRDKRTEAIMAGARLLEQSESVQESGNARQLRFASETATLTSVLHQSCALLERSLRNVAALKGLPVNEITVNAPQTLLDQSMTPTDFAALFGVYEAGGMSWDTYYENGQRGGIFSTERDADAEFKLVDDRQDDDGAALVVPQRAMPENPIEG